VYPRWYWRAFAAPGIIWLILFVVVPTYAVIAVAMGGESQLQLPVPAWNPSQWNIGFLNEAVHSVLPGGTYWNSVVNTFAYVLISLAACLAIGYPVAYYIARHAGRTKTLLLVLLILPFWVSYLMRMLAWIGLLLPDGYVNQVLAPTGLVGREHLWLNGQPSSVIWALTYGYIPYLILPLYAALDRIDRSHLEAARDLGANPFRAFLHVTLPLSMQGILAGAVLITLPMFGDYYTNDLISASPNTNMVGNTINLLIQGGTEKELGASLVLILYVFLMVLMSYYLYATAKATLRQQAE
jgi:spermidine/putrescine transport system permease protein